jgi:hypothetical protein
MVFVPKQRLYDKFPSASHKLLHNPRLCRLIASLDSKDFNELDSASAVYWKAYTWISNSNRTVNSPDISATGLIDDGLKATGARSLGWHEHGPQPEPIQENRVPLSLSKWSFL